jgi:methylmalonyl-CoA/ethylmalonyl-CoA epimerase
MRLHHIAYVTDNIEKRAEHLAKLLGLTAVGPSVIDPVQRVRIQFMQAQDGNLLELLEPHGTKSPVEQHLRNGGGIYHLCFEVDDLDSTLQRLVDTDEAMIVCEPVAAPALANRRVAFVVTSDRDLIEFVEAG